MKLRRVVLLLGAGLLLAACAPRSPSSSLRISSYAHPVPPGVTFDLAQGRAITPGRLEVLLARTRLLFLGEHHTEPRSHQFQIEVLRNILRRRGRGITVALEMFPPSANEALEDWRQGRIADEGEFLERSGWYRHWGFPWAYYRDLFLLLRRHRLRVVGINAEKTTRAAARKGDLSTLSEALRKEIGPLQPAPEAAGVFLLDILREGGHGEDLDQQVPEFLAYLRVQWLWNRLMGLRAARLAEGAGEKEIVVVLVGSGHLAHQLGVNLQAARVTAALQLTIWDDVRAKSPKGSYAVPVGMAELARVYEEQPDRRGWPSMAGIGLEPEAAGGGAGAVKIKALRRPPGSSWRALKAGDVITALNGTPVTSPARLRLAYENLKIGGTARFTLRRKGKTLTVKIPVTEPEFQ